MSRTVINPDTVFNSVQYGFSQAVVVTGSRRMLLSGQVGIDVHERTVGPGLQEQTEAALDNIERVLPPRADGSIRSSCCASISAKRRVKTRR